MKSHLLCIGLITCAFGCATPPWEDERPRVRDSLLAHVPESDQTRISEARTRLSELQEQLAAARADEGEAERLEEIAERNLDSLRAREKTAEEAVAYARTYRTNSDLEQARKEVDEIEAAIRLAKSQHRYQEDLVALAEERADLLQKRIQLAEARLELEKARAVRNLDRPAAEDVDVDAHRSTVRDLVQEVEQARIEALVARERLDLQKQFVEKCQEGVPEALRLQQIRSIDSVFESAAFEQQKQDMADEDIDEDDADDRRERERERQLERERQPGNNGDR